MPPAFCGGAGGFCEVPNEKSSAALAISEPFLFLCFCLVCQAMAHLQQGAGNSGQLMLAHEELVRYSRTLVRNSVLEQSFVGSSCLLFLDFCMKHKAVLDWFPKELQCPNKTDCRSCIIACS